MRLSSDLDITSPLSPSSQVIYELQTFRLARNEYILASAASVEASTPSKPDDHVIEQVADELRPVIAGFGLPGGHGPTLSERRLTQRAGTDQKFALGPHADQINCRSLQGKESAGNWLPTIAPTRPSVIRFPIWILNEDRGQLRVSRLVK